MRTAPALSENTFTSQSLPLARSWRSTSEVASLM